MDSTLVSDTRGTGFDFPEPTDPFNFILSYVPSFVQNKFPLHVQKNYINTLIVLSFVQNELGLC